MPLCEHGRHSPNHCHCLECWWPHGAETRLPSQGSLRPQLADSATCPLQIQWGEMGDLAGANESQTIQISTFAPQYTILRC